ncbi:uncharacterized protein LOC135935366 [Cloeon dipterum]|uniref:uncharacterized protein LOC135935366 n=1 Tax=Cloeon dipterum TaxID=197152 RepID=UPI0032207797
MSYGLASSQATSLRALPMQHRGFPARMDYYTTPGLLTSKSKRRSESSGWSSSSSSSGGSSSSTTASNAAVSALALLSFLFFLNMLQQNLAAGQQQTLLFMVNNTAATGTTANASRLTLNRRRRPLIALAQVNAKQGFNGRTKLTIKAMKKMRLKKRRRPRDLNDEPEPFLEYSNDIDLQTEDEQYDDDDTDLTMADEDEEGEEAPPVMMPGLEHSGALQLSAWLQGQIGADQMRYDLVDTLTNCRAVVACNLHKASKQGTLTSTPTSLPDDSLKKLLGEAGEYAESGHLDEACEDLLLAAGDECNALAKSFSALLPNLNSLGHSITGHKDGEDKPDL